MRSQHGETKVKIMIEIIDGQESIVMSLGKDAAKALGTKLGIETAQVYQLRVEARKTGLSMTEIAGATPQSKDDNSSPAVTAGSSPESREPRLPKSALSKKKKAEIKDTANDQSAISESLNKARDLLDQTRAKSKKPGKHPNKFLSKKDLVDTQALLDKASKDLQTLDAKQSSKLSTAKSNVSQLEAGLAGATARKQAAEKLQSEIQERLAGLRSKLAALKAKPK